MEKNYRKLYVGGLWEAFETPIRGMTQFVAVIRVKRGHIENADVYLYLEVK